MSFRVIFGPSRSSCSPPATKCPSFCFTGLAPEVLSSTRAYGPVPCHPTQQPQSRLSRFIPDSRAGLERPWLHIPLLIDLVNTLCHCELVAITWLAVFTALGRFCLLGFFPGVRLHFCINLSGAFLPLPNASAVAFSFASPPNPSSHFSLSPRQCFVVHDQSLDFLVRPFSRLLGCEPVS